MLVSAIARLSAVSNMNYAAMNMMGASNSMMSAMRSRTFGGEHNLDMLHEMDERNSLDLISNSLLYQISYLQEKEAAKRQNQELKRNKLDVLA